MSPPEHSSAPPPSDPARSSADTNRSPDTNRSADTVPSGEAGAPSDTTQLSHGGTAPYTTGAAPSPSPGTAPSPSPESVPSSSPPPTVTANRRDRWLRNPHDSEILRLAIPAFGALVAEPLFLLTDSVVVGHLGTPQLAALGLAGTALQTLVGIFVFLAYATTAAVARHLGAGDLRSALTYGMDGMWLALGLGAVMAMAGVLLAPQVVALFDPSPAVAAHAVSYLRISALGIPAMLVVFAGSGVLRGLQDTKTPLYVAGVSYVANAVLNIVLVYPVGLGLPGSAWGTVIAQSGGALVFVLVVVSSARRHDARLRPDIAGIRSAATAGAPLIVRTLTLRAALLVTTYVATSLGDAPLAANQVAFTIWNTLALALDALAIAGQAIVGRALGAGDVRSVRAATRRMMEWGIGCGLVFGVALVAARPLYVPAFTTDPTVRGLLFDVLVILAIWQPVAGVVFVLDGVLIGAGDGKYLALAGVLTLFAFLPLAGLVFYLDSSLVALWWAFGGWTFARLVTLVARERSSAWLVTGAVRR